MQFFLLFPEMSRKVSNASLKRQTLPIQQSYAKNFPRTVNWKRTSWRFCSSYYNLPRGSANVKEDEEEEKAEKLKKCENPSDPTIKVMLKLKDTTVGQLDEACYQSAQDLFAFVKSKTFTKKFDRASSQPQPYRELYRRMDNRGERCITNHDTEAEPSKDSQLWPARKRKLGHARAWP